MTTPRTCDVRRGGCARGYGRLAWGGLNAGNVRRGRVAQVEGRTAGSGKRGGLQQLAQLLHLLRKHRRHATAHRHPVQGLRNLHRALLMRHHNQLRTLPQLTNHL